MPSFVHPALLWGLLLAGLPVLIHLINRVRYRRVAWAAMEFLLESRRRRRTQIWLKELLLLLLRVGAVVLLVLLAAQPVFRSALADLLGGRVTHHMVLLDDSFSMSDRWEETSAFDRAKRAVASLVGRAAEQPQRQRVSLLRFSRAGQADQRQAFDLLDQPVDEAVSDRLRRMLEPMEPSFSDSGPLPALKQLQAHLADDRNRRRIVYVISDFRARDWQNAQPLRELLDQLQQQDVAVRLIRCADTEHENLAIAQLRTVGGVQAADVPIAMEVVVANYGRRPIRSVPVLLEVDQQTQPAVEFGQIDPGQSAAERFSVQFATAGMHQVAARLPSDAVDADNVQYCLLAVVPEAAVLLVDGDARALDARYVAAALAPGGPARTGINPQIEPPEYLRNRNLGAFAAVWLLNVGRLEPAVVDSLEKYVASGGGLVAVLGQQSQAEWINRSLYCDGKGLFPAPLDKPEQLLANPLEPIPDVEPSDHPVFRIFAGSGRSFLAAILVDRYFAVRAGWQPPPQTSVQVLAKLRNGDPLVLEHRFGRGRVVALLTTTAPTWNNWARDNPSFVVTMLELVAHVAARDDQQPHLVCQPVVLRLDPERYTGHVRYGLPHDAHRPEGAVQASPQADGMLAATLPLPDRPGFYSIDLEQQQGDWEARPRAVNVNPEEGRLALVSPEQLAGQLRGIDYQVADADHLVLIEHAPPGGSTGAMFVLLLLGVLLIEQLVAYSASYHPRDSFEPGRRAWPRFSAGRSSRSEPSPAAEGAKR